jgi:hypothetical protein
MSQQSAMVAPSMLNPALGALAASTPSIVSVGTSGGGCSQLAAELINAGARALACTDRAPLDQIVLSRCEAKAAAVILVTLRKLEEAGASEGLADLIQIIQETKGCRP